MLAGNTDVDNVTGAVTTKACSSGALSLASFPTILPLALTILIVAASLF